MELSEQITDPAQINMCGCGRSTGGCQGLHALSQQEWEEHSANELAKSLAAVQTAMKAEADRVAALPAV